MSPKIILVSIVKNEEHIIRRCIESAIPILDGICITDTGSTDNTISVIKNFAIEKSIPCKVYNDKWKNFGYNRTNSFKNAQEFTTELGWDLNTTYGLLLDADMKLVVGKDFNKNEITIDQFQIIQESYTLSYYNKRIIRLNINWVCVGVTHEYWQSPQNTIKNKLTKNKLYIDDIGDGGSKKEKFNRDIKLLVDGIKEEPKNKRYHFYLAQSYKDTKQYDKAIEYYKKRIALDGWDEEVWYSYYMISHCYMCMEDEKNFVDYAIQAFIYRPQRSESIYKLVKYFRQRNEHRKAYTYYLIGKAVPYPENDILFIEKNVYNYLYDYEYSILYYYIFPEKRIEGLLFSLHYINKFDNETFEIVFSNLEFYAQRLLDIGEEITLNIKDYNIDFIPSSIALVPYDDNKILANIRFVNYRIINGKYVMSKNGNMSANHSVRTENGYLFFDNSFRQISKVKMISNTLDDIVPSTDIRNDILGIEDIRLYRDANNKICYTGTTAEYSYNRSIRIVNGEYDIASAKLVRNKILRPPQETICEKNWIGYKDIFIYSWCPLTVGNLNDKNQLQFTHIIPTPPIFKHFRGSSNLLLFKNELWCVTHYVKYATSSKYFHVIVVIDPLTFAVKRYTPPFYFDRLGIEYCLGLIIIKNIIYTTVSRNDCNPVICKVNIDKLTWV
jgi:tetratricopeptide (TPR) repeat protein